MVGYRLRRAAAAALVMALGCSRGPEPAAGSAAGFRPTDLTGSEVMAEVRRFVELGRRDSGTPGAGKAAGYIRRRLEETGIACREDGFRDSTPAGETVFRNVYGVIEGRGPGLIVLGSHYDTKAGMPPAFEGANDSGSSTGLLLALGRVFRRGPKPAADIMLAFFDGEECRRSYGPDDGLHGSRRLAARLAAEGRKPEVAAVIVLDMIGDRDLRVEFPPNGARRLVAMFFEAARAEGARLKFGLGKRPVIDDHAPFLAAGMPAICVIDFEYGSSPGANDYWHTAADTLDKLSPESLETVGRTTIRVVNRLLREVETKNEAGMGGAVDGAGRGSE